MVDVIFAFRIDGNSALNALEADSGTLSDMKSTAQLGGNHQLALGCNHTFQRLHVLHSSIISKTLPVCPTDRHIALEDHNLAISWGRRKVLECPIEVSQRSNPEFLPAKRFRRGLTVVA